MHMYAYILQRALTMCGVFAISQSAAMRVHSSISLLHKWVAVLVDVGEHGVANTSTSISQGPDHF